MSRADTGLASHSVAVHTKPSLAFQDQSEAFKETNKNNSKEASNGRLDTPFSKTRCNLFFRFTSSGDRILSQRIIRTVAAIRHKVKYRQTDN